MGASDLTPFEGLAPWATASVLGAYFLGFFIRGAFGFGSNLPIVLITAWVLGPHHAILLAVLAASVAQAHLLPQGIGTADWGVARPLVLGQLAGCALGVWLFRELAADWLTLVMGVLIVAILVMDRFRLLERLARRIDLRSRTVNTGLAATSGLVGTVSGGGGIYFLVVYLKLVCATPTALRGTNLVLSGFFMLGRLAFMALAGLFGPSLLVETVLLLPAVFLGTRAGTRFFHGASPVRFYAWLQGVLLFAAVALLAKGAVRVAAG